MARKGASQSAKIAPISTKEGSTNPTTPEDSTTSSSKATADESFQAEESSGSTCPVVLFKPEARLNPDVLELIFRHLDFKELLAVELVCKQWKEVVDNRRLYKQLAKRICSRKVNIGFTRSGFQKQLKEVRRGRFKKKS